MFGGPLQQSSSHSWIITGIIYRRIWYNQGDRCRVEQQSPLVGDFKKTFVARAEGMKQRLLTAARV